MVLSVRVVVVMTVAETSTLLFTFRNFTKHPIIEAGQYNRINTKYHIIIPVFSTKIVSE